MKIISTIVGDFDSQRAKRLKKDYDQAVKEERLKFNFEGQVIYLPFAKYLVENLTNQHLLPT